MTTRLLNLTEAADVELLRTVYVTRSSKESHSGNHSCISTPSTISPQLQRRSRAQQPDVGTAASVYLMLALSLLKLS